MCIVRNVEVQMF